jgi:hypothetical protein
MFFVWTIEISAYKYLHKSYQQPPSYALFIVFVNIISIRLHSQTLNLKTEYEWLSFIVRSSHKIQLYYFYFQLEYKYMQQAYEKPNTR